MANENDLYTDYALQIFSSYMVEDVMSMKIILDSFKEDGKGSDVLFLPGLIYGLLYHLGTFITIVSESSEVPVENLLSDYAIDYAMKREHLLLNPLLNVNKAGGMFEKIVEELKMIEDMFNDAPEGED